MKRNKSTEEGFRKVNGWDQAVSYRCHVERIGQLAQKWGLKKKALSKKICWGRVENKMIVLHVMRMNEVETCWWDKELLCCVEFELKAKQWDGRGNSSVAEREICHLFNSSWVCAWDSPDANELQICREDGNQTQSLMQPSQRGQDPECKWNKEFQVGKHDQLCQRHMWALVIHQLLIWEASLCRESRRKVALFWGWIGY